MQRNANSRHGVEDIMTAGHGHFDALDPPRGTVAVADHHIEAIAAGHWLDILPANVGLRAEAISNHSAVLHPRQDCLHFRMIEAEQSCAVKQDIANKFDKGVLHPVEDAIMENGRAKV